MLTFQLIGILLVFIIMSGLMFFRKIPALIALPLMAFLIPLISGVPLIDIVHFVIGQGSVKLYNAYTITMFGSMLSVFLQKTGVAENLIKKGAELSGDKPWTISIIMLILIILLFTTLTGLGAIIMIATIVLPIMSSVGLGPLTIVGIFLFGLSIGGTLNASNWALYIEILNLSLSEVRSFAIIMFIVSFIVSLFYLTFQIYGDVQEVNLKKISIISISLFIIILAFLFFYQNLNEQSIYSIKKLIDSIWIVFKFLISLLIFFLFGYNLFRILFRIKIRNQIHWTSYVTPIIPLLLILIFELNFIAAFIIGLIYGALSLYHKGILNVLIRSIFDGGSAVMPAVFLMFGIGMLLNAIMGPGEEWIKINNHPWPVLSLLQPLLKEIIPHNQISYVVTFTLLAPMALYRGPLNVWGMGYGLAGILLASGLNPGAIMGMLLALGQIQGISDPTNTHNVWLANEMKVDVQKILWNTLPYTWFIACIGLIISAIKFLN